MENQIVSNEIDKLLTVVDNEDVANYLMLEEMRSRKDDETITFDEYKKVIAKNYCSCNSKAK